MKIRRQKEKPPGEFVTVLAYLVADPKQRIHLASEASWEIIGSTLCGETIKRRTEAPDDGDPCATCELIAKRDYR